MGFDDIGMGVGILGVSRSIKILLFLTKSICTIKTELEKRRGPRPYALKKMIWDRGNDQKWLP
jgi:hypothetical protein